MRKGKGAMNEVDSFLDKYRDGLYSFDDLKASLANQVANATSHRQLVDIGVALAESGIAGCQAMNILPTGEYVPVG